VSCSASQDQWCNAGSSISVSTLLGYIIDGRILVLANSSEQDQTFEGVEIPDGTWQLIGNGVHLDHANGVEGSDSALEGATSFDLMVRATSAKIWARR